MRTRHGIAEVLSPLTLLLHVVRRQLTQLLLYRLAQRSLGFSGGCRGG